jgi:hypothetical protein
MEIDDYLARLASVAADIGDRDLRSANETTTRKLVIDRILEEALGWKPGTDVVYEERNTEDGQTTFADYVVGVPTASFVVEAKRFGESFSLPIKQTSAVLGGVLSSGSVGEAIRQARDYARGRSIQYAVVTNGESWVIFPAIRTDRITFEKTRATIFKTLEDIKERFAAFWGLLSRDSVLEDSLAAHFFLPASEVVQKRLVDILPEPGFRIGRNRVYDHIESAVLSALSDEHLLHDAAGLEKCYVKSAERVKFDERLKVYLQDVKPNLGRSVVRPRAGGDEKVLDKSIEQYDYRTYSARNCLRIGQLRWHVVRKHAENGTQHVLAQARPVSGSTSPLKAGTKVNHALLS